MKQCPRCNRNYADEALSFCLEDGTALIEKFDAQATLINPNPPIPVVPPTVAFKEPPPASPAYVPRPARAASVPPTRSRRSKWLVGALVVLALGVGLTIGGVIFQRANQPSIASETPDPVRDPIASQSPTPASAKSSSTPAIASTPVASPSTTPNVDQSKPKEPVCVLDNDKSDKTTVNVRSDCNLKNCEEDASTLLTEYPEQTPIRVIWESEVPTKNFRWVQVIIVSSGRMVWVAKTKIFCGGVR